MPMVALTVSMGCHEAYCVPDSSAYQYMYTLFIRTNSKRGAYTVVSSHMHMDPSDANRSRV